MPVFMIFKTMGDDCKSCYIGSYNTFSEADVVIKDLRYKKQAGEDYYIVQGYRYG